MYEVQGTLTSPTPHPTPPQNSDIQKRAFYSYGFRGVSKIKSLYSLQKGNCFLWAIPTNWQSIGHIFSRSIPTLRAAPQLRRQLENFALGVPGILRGGLLRAVGQLLGRACPGRCPHRWQRPREILLWLLGRLVGLFSASKTIGP